jgi:hypothetical protein
LRFHVRALGVVARPRLITPSRPSR